MNNHKFTYKEIDLGKIWQIIKLDKKKVFISSGITTLIAIIYCIFATPIFTGKVLINPPKLTDALNSGFMAQLGNFGSLGGIAGGLLQKSDADIATVLLKSNAISDMIIKKFDLMKRYHKTDIEYTRLALKNKVSYVPDIKSGFLEIDVDDPDPKIAAGIANFYTVALGTLINNTEYNRSKQKADFFEGQLPQYKGHVVSAESKLREFCKAHGITAAQQGEVVTIVTTQLEAALATAQARLNAMQVYATPENPDYKELQAQVTGIASELTKLSGQGNNNLTAPAGLTTDLAQEYYNLVSDERIAEEAYLAMVKRYYMTTVDAVIQLQPVAIQVLDPAQIPLHKSKPKRLFILLGAMFFGLFVGSLIVIIKNRKEFN